MLGQLAFELLYGTSVQRAYVYAEGKLLAQQSVDGQFYWVHTDHLGTTRKLTNSSGVVVYRGEFDSHGKTLLEWGGANLNMKKFTEYEKDAATELDYANARTFNGGRGRFMQADPIGVGGANKSQPESLNRYAYVGNDPVNFVDPTGTKAILAAPRGPDGNWGWFDPSFGGGEMTGYWGGVIGGSRWEREYDAWTKALQDTARRVMNILNQNGPCANYFGPNALAALNALQNDTAAVIKADLSQGVQPSQTGISMTFLPTSPADIQRGYRVPDEVTVLRNGPVFLNPGAPSLGGYSPGSDGAQMVAILHELAHMIIIDDGNGRYHFLIPNDGGNASQSATNTTTITQNCGNEIQSQIGR